MPVCPEYLDRMEKADVGNMVLPLFSGEERKALTFDEIYLFRMSLPALTRRS